MGDEEDDENHVAYRPSDNKLQGGDRMEKRFFAVHDVDVYGDARFVPKQAMGRSPLQDRDLTVAGAVGSMMFYEVDEKFLDSQQRAREIHWRSEYQLLQDEVEELRELVEHYKDNVKWWERNSVLEGDELT